MYSHCFEVVFWTTSHHSLFIIGHNNFQSFKVCLIHWLFELKWLYNIVSKGRTIALLFFFSELKKRFKLLKTNHNTSLETLLRLFNRSCKTDNLSMVAPKQKIGRKSVKNWESFFISQSKYRMHCFDDVTIQESCIQKFR